MIYFTADPHYNHSNIIEYCKRPFNNPHSMNKALIRKYNELVSPNDTCYFLGDICFPANQPDLIQRTLAKLNGTKHLILGNHDNLKPFDYIEYGFSSVHTSLELKIISSIGYIDVVLVHDPALSIINRNKLFLGGHVHDLFTIKKNFINVGVDAHNFYPVSSETIAHLYKQHIILEDIINVKSNIN